MCYDISFTVKIKEIADYFPDLEEHEQLDFDFTSTHIVGHQYGLHPILYRTKENKILLRGMEWGIIPHYQTYEEKFHKLRATMLNIRSERILDDPKSYWYKIRNKRCLIPINGFYEHRDVEGWKKKVPYYIWLKLEETFFVPGLYAAADLVDKATGEITKTYTFGIITRAANNIMKAIHNCGDNKWRMPLMVPLSYAKRWLDAELPEQDYREILNYEMPSEEMEYFTVYTIRSPKERPDFLGKNAKYEWADLPPLEVQTD